MMALHLSLPLTLLIFFFSFFSEFASLAQTQCLPGQRQALLQLKNGFNTPKLQSWNSAADCCTWEGVTCDPATGLVTVLELSNRSISGSIDPAFFNLSSLQNLSLAYNLFNNVTLPETGFERLSNLIHLNLSNSGFVGQIPTGISQLTNLVLLDLSTFYLNVGSSSLYLREPSIKTLLSNLTKLQVLYLDGVNISSNGSKWGPAVSQLGPTLRSLSMSVCSLMGPFDQSLNQLSQISYLRLDGNNLGSPVPEFFANFSYLSVLQLSSCLINGEFPKRILQLKNLKEIDLSDNPMLSGQLPEFEKDSSLQTLILSATNFSGQIPDSIGNLKNLSTFLIYDCNFHGEITTNFQKLEWLSHLDISWNRFTGEIPKFHNWQRISEYVLNNNNFDGSIPDSSSYAGLGYLSKIDLRNNSLSGIIPISLFSLPSLQFLLLSQNQLLGNLPEFSKRSPVLQTIDISSNNLQGPLPRSIFKFSQLNVLNIASNNFTGMVDLDSLWYLKNLTSIDLSNNMLSVTDGAIGNISWYTSFPNIKTLKLVSCNLTKFPSFMRYQSGISNLDLSNNKIGGTIPNWVQKTGNQTYLAFNLSHNLFTGLETDTPFLTLETLVILDLHSNMLNGTVPLPPPSIIVFDLSQNRFSRLPPNLTSYLGFILYLSLSNNKLTGSIPGSICNASYLQVLDLSYNNFMGELPHCLLENASTLAVLNLKNNKLTGSFPQAISEDCGFKTINLNGNNLNGILPQSLMNCASLEVLDLGNNEIDGVFPYWLGKLNDLKVLVLRSNKFYGPVSKPRSQSGTNDSAAFSKLQILDLSSNYFNGALPKECFKTLNSMMVNSKNSTSLIVGVKYLDFGSYYQNSVTVTFKGLEITFVSTLAIFTSLDFSGNGFVGKIPQEIGELKMLDLLNMSHNALTGTIPPQIGDLNQLESLDLSSNELTGNIPEELTLLTFLSSLNLSHNNLVGKVPQKSQFPTFSNSSYLYNPGLCGDPLTVQCGVPLSEFPASNTKFSINLNWQFIFSGLGFGAGFAVVLGPLMVWNEWREQFNMYVDCLLQAVLPLWICSSIYNRVGSEDEENEPVKLDEVDEDEETLKFCLFCTKLEIIGEKVVLSDWWLVTSNVEGESKGLAVAGYIAKKESQLPFMSTPIVKRHDTYTLEAADGVTVKVEGMINQTNTLKNGFSHEMCKSFNIGFPILWKQYIDSFADTTPTPGTNPSQILEQFETGTGNILNPNMKSADPIVIDDDTLGHSPGSITTKEFEPAHEGNPSSSDNNTKAKKVANLEEGDTTNLEKEDTTSKERSDAPQRSGRTKVAVVNNEEDDTTNLEKEPKSNRRSDAPRKSGRIKQHEHGPISTDGKEAEEFSTPQKDDTLSDKKLPSVGRRKNAVATVPDVSPTSVKRSSKKDHILQSRDKTSGKGRQRANMKAHGANDNVPLSESNIRRSRSGRAIIPTVDKGSQTVVYDQNGNFAGIATPVAVSTGSMSNPGRKKRRF